MKRYVEIELQDETLNECDIQSWIDECLIPQLPDVNMKVSIRTGCDGHCRTELEKQLEKKDEEISHLEDVFAKKVMAAIKKRWDNAKGYNERASWSEMGTDFETIVSELKSAAATQKENSDENH